MFVIDNANAMDVMQTAKTLSPGSIAGYSILLLLYVTSAMRMTFGHTTLKLVSWCVSLKTDPQPHSDLRVRW